MRLTSQFSPLKLLTETTCQDGVVDAIDTCRIFEDSYDFWDDYGDGWAVLARSMTASDICEDSAWAEFFSWFLQFSNSDIKFFYASNRVSERIRHAGPETFDSIGLLLELGPPGAINGQSSGITPLVDSILTSHPEKSRMLLAWGADPHRSSFYYHSNSIETPLSVAMYSLRNFCSFRDALMEMNLHVEDFVRRELEQGGPLMDDGWRVETLSALLKLDFEPGTEPALYCTSCYFGWDYNARVQPHWQYTLERIKNGNYVQNARSDTHLSGSQSCSSISNNDSPANATNGSALSYDPALPDDQSKQSDEEPVTIENANSRLAPRREDFWCFKCWVHFKKTGRPRSPPVTKSLYSDADDPSKDDFSPFLFNT